MVSPDAPYKSLPEFSTRLADLGIELLTAILLTACATPIEWSQVPSTPSCRTSLASLPFCPLPSGSLRSATSPQQHTDIRQPVHPP